MIPELKFFETANELCVHLCGEIDHHTARGIREQIDARLFQRRASVLELDFSGVCFMDSSAIALIIGRHEIASALGTSVRLSGLSDAHKKLLRISGIEKLKNLTVRS